MQTEPLAVTAVEVTDVTEPIVTEPMEPATLGAVEMDDDDDLEGKKKSPTKPRKARTSTGHRKSSSALKRPKRPRTAYHFFYDARRKEELDKDPERDNNELSKQIGEEWKVMKDDDKTPYELDAASAKAEYEAACRDYEVASGKKMEDCQPKKPLTAYMIFFQARHLEQKSGAGEKSVDDFSKKTGAEWKKMTEDEKYTYYEQSRESKAAYERQISFLQKSKIDLIGQTFVDLLRDGATATVSLWDEEKDIYTLAYDGSPEPVYVGMPELRARVCGDDKASKRANKPPKKSPADLAALRAAREAGGTPTKKRKKKEKKIDEKKDDPDTTLANAADAAVLGIGLKDTVVDEDLVVVAPAPVEEAEDDDEEEPADDLEDEPPKKKKKTTTTTTTTKTAVLEKAPESVHPHDAAWMQVGKDDSMPEEDMVNVVRLSRRLVGGACVQNLKKMCTAIHVPVTGSKSVLGTRLELYLRHHDFKNNPFLPSADDVEQLNIEAFNDKYENEEPLTIDHVTDVLAQIQASAVPDVPTDVFALPDEVEPIDSIEPMDVDDARPKPTEPDE